MALVEYVLLRIHLIKARCVREWKKSAEVQKVHDDLYSPNNPDDPSSDTYISLIIQSVFTSENDRTNENEVWAQSVIQAIFDERHLSTKIDAEIIQT